MIVGDVGALDRDLAITPDGSRVIYPRRWQVSNGGGRMPLWSRNGQELFYLPPDDALMGVRVEPGLSWRSSNPERILPGQFFYGATEQLLGERTTSRREAVPHDQRGT